MKRLLYAYPAILTLLLLVGGGSLARALCPVTAIALGFLLFSRARMYYMDFVLWCWFLSPFFRRVMDYEAGWKDPSLILLTPYLVTLIAPVCDWKKLVSVPMQPVLLFIIALAMVAYGVLVGLAFQPIAAMASALILWVTPVLFAWWYAASDGYERRMTLHSTERSFVSGLIAMGVYGCLQFVLVPAWDSNWLTQLGLSSSADVTSMGIPEPFQIRVFSTMNSPGTFALVVAAAILFVTSLKLRGANIAIALGFASLVLTQGRSAWLCLGFGLLILCFSAPRKVFRTVGIVGAAALLLGPIFLALPASEAIRSKILSTAAIGNDTSAVERKKGFADAMNMVLEHPAGLGIGVREDIIASDGSFSLHDNGLIEAFLTLGWFGGTAYLLALLTLTFTSIAQGSANESSRHTAKATSLALLSQLLFGTGYLGVSGFFLWLFVAFAATPDASLTPVFSREAVSLDNAQ